MEVSYSHWNWLAASIVAVIGTIAIVNALINSNLDLKSIIAFSLTIIVIGASLTVWTFLRFMNRGELL